MLVDTFLPRHRHLGLKKHLTSSPAVNPGLNHVPTHHVYTMSFNHPQGWQLNHVPGQPVPMFDNLLVKKLFLILSLNLPWHNFRLFPLVLSLVIWEQRLTPPHCNLLSGSCREGKVSPQPPSLQTKQAQFPQLILMALVLKTLHQLHCSSLDSKICIFLTSTPVYSHSAKNVSLLFCVPGFTIQSVSAA